MSPGGAQIQVTIKAPIGGPYYTSQFAEYAGFAAMDLVLDQTKSRIDTWSVQVWDYFLGPYANAPTGKIVIGLRELGANDTLIETQKLQAMPHPTFR